MPYFEDGSSGPILTLTSSMSSILPITIGGVGQGDDLSVVIKRSPDGRWYPMVHKGWYYKGIEERYLFADMQTRTVVIPSKSATGITVSGTPALSSVIEYGPVFLTNILSEGYKYIDNSFRAMRTLSWTSVSGTNLWTTTLSSAIVASILDSSSESLERVPSSSLVLQNDLYYHDPLSGLLVVASSTNPSSLCISYTASSSGSDSLLVEEIHQVDSDYKVRTTYSGIEANNSSPTLLPVVISPNGTTFTASASSVETSSNRIAVPSGSFNAYDIVAVRYRVSNSFSIIENKLWAFSTSATTAYLTFEGSEEDYQDTSLLSETDDSYIQLNSIYSGVGPGFLYLSEKISPLSSAAALYLTCSPTLTNVLSAKGPQVRIKARIVDKDGNPVQGIKTVLTQSASCGYLESTAPTGSITNWLGEVCYTWRPSAVGINTFSVSASGTSLSSSCSAQVVAAKDIRYPTDNYILPKLYLILDTNTIKDNIATVRAAIKQKDGSFYPIEGLEVYFTCNIGRFKGSNSQGNNIVSLTNKLGYATTEYEMATGDTIVASIKFPTSLGGDTIGNIYSEKITVNI